MRALDLDYVARPAWSNPGGLTILALSVLVAAGAAWLYVEQIDGRAALEARRHALERLHKRQAAPGVAVSGDTQELLAEIRRANEVTDQLDLPWSPLFNSVEAASHESVALLGIQPDAQKRAVLIAAEGKDMASVVEYVKRLEKEPALSQVHLVNHQVQEQEPERPLRFSVQAVWRDKATGK